MKEIEAYEYSVNNNNGKLRVKKVLFIEEYEDKFRGWNGYYIKSKTERRTRLNRVIEIEKGVYQCPWCTDHFYTIKRNSKRALELLIKHYELKAEDYKISLANALGKVKYLKFLLKEMEEEK